MKNYLNRIGINAVKAGLKIINKEKKNKILGYKTKSEVIHKDDMVGFSK